MTRLLIITALLGLSACKTLDPPPPEEVNLYRHFTMVDRNGHPVGTVTFRPVGTGEIRDRQGRLIGIITNP